MDQLRPLKQGPAVPAHYCFPYVNAQYIQAILMHAWASPPAERASACLPCTAGWLQNYTIASVCHARSLSVQMLVLVDVTRLRSYSVVATWRQRCEKNVKKDAQFRALRRQTPPRQRSSGAHDALCPAHVIAQCVRAVWDRYDIAVIFLSR